jgi:Pseudouridylate synthase
VRYAITVSYLGTNYCGWQNQKNGVSVQEVLEKAFTKLFGTKTAVYGSGRTDAGVHALGQVAHFDAETSIPAEKIPFAVNTMLPEDIRVTACKEVDDTFHARFRAKRKTYVYRIYYAPHGNPLFKCYGRAHQRKT